MLLDRDLAHLYGVETRRLNEQVQRNIERFPDDFMFRLSNEEFETLKSQNAISNTENNLISHYATSSWGGIRKMPYAFTENGIAMLSGVLRSPQAIRTNILIMRAFTAMRHFIGSHAQMFQRLETIEYNQLTLNAQITKNQIETDRKFEDIFRRLDDESVTPKQGIFFDGQVFNAYRFISDKIREAKKRIIIFDNYANDEVLTLIDKRNTGVTAIIYTKHIDRQLQLDINRHNKQYPNIEVEVFDRTHDRFLCIDDIVYHIGASLKDLGKKWFGFNKMELTTDELLAKI